jgi:c-di-AMP phosphodiesterase-like protein
MYLGIVGILLLIYLIVHNYKTTHARKKSWEKYIESLSADIDSAARYAILNLPIPLTLIDSSGKISWYNSKFSDMVGEKDILDKNIEKLLNNFNLGEYIFKDEQKLIKMGEKTYKLLFNIVKTDENHEDRNVIMLYWIDYSNYTKLKNLYNDEKVIISLIQIDNYDEVMQSTKEDKRPFVRSEIDAKVNLWATRMNAMIKKYQEDKYLVSFENKYLENLEQKRFAILDDVREIDAGNTIPVTLSIGVGAKSKSLSEAETYAYSALELALGRGGDQAVVRKISNFDFYGGKAKAVEKRNRVKARVIAHGLRPLIDESEKVIIMGHKNPDMDSFGAAIGVYRAALNRGKDAYIVLDSVNEAISNVYSTFEDNEIYEFINHEAAKELINENTLLVVVDTHRPSIVECEELLNRTERIVLFDHHRRSTEFIENTLLKYVEPYASSTSELVTEILQYISNESKLEKKEAEALLAGIYVDTKGFTFKTGVRTFEAASYLRRFGADTINVRQLFQDDIETFITKAEIVRSSQVIFDEIAVSICPENGKNIQLASAQAADEMLNIKGISVSFVIGLKDNGTVFISGRSLGQINVQLILEKIGGGGHLTVAGAQLKDSSISEAREKLFHAIEEYFEEGEK